MYHSTIDYSSEVQERLDILCEWDNILYDAENSNGLLDDVNSYIRRLENCDFFYADDIADLLDEIDDFILNSKDYITEQEQALVS